MPPKSRGRPTGSDDKSGSGEDVSRSRVGKGKGKGKEKTNEARAQMGRSRRNRIPGKTTSSSVVPDVFQDMFAEALMSPNVEGIERPRKRRRVRQPGDELAHSSALSYATQDETHGDDDAALEFEDVIPSRQEQTAYNDSDEGSSEGDLAWEEVQNTTYSSKPGVVEDNDGDLDLTLGTEKSPHKSSPATRRKILNKSDRALRLNIHKMHLLCLLCHVDRRNSWCNDPEVQRTLKSLLTKQMVECLKPKESYTQFGKAESVKRGLLLITKMWESNYRVTARGMQRPFWAENEQEIRQFQLSPGSDSLREKSEFREAAKELQGSRDVGTQLCCALLRSAGLDVRLVCSLQLLPFSATAKGSASTRFRDSPTVLKSPTDEVSEEEMAVDNHGEDSPFNTGGSGAPGMPFTSRRRLGHPNAADYFMPKIDSPSSVSLKKKPKPTQIHESPYPVFWVEVLDEAHQRWMPVNPMDGISASKPREFEPPASDPENNMSYVIAFEDDGAARDVTRRYAKAFNAKTLKNRVESTEGGERWWRKTMRFYSRGWKSDLEQIEDMELATAEAREPMPKSVADFKGHPLYALERHLRRNEVLFNPREVGKVAAGRDSGGRKKLESVYRRRDVKLVKSADGWYRIGREVKVGEQPVKIVAPRKQGDDVEDDEENAGTALYTENQTELYNAPPVVNGRVPKNSYGNLDIYVPSMVPFGGIHIPDADASRAARMLTVDYADAVTGFEFRGRHGTAIIKGIIAATEYKDAIEAVMEGFRDEQAQLEEEMRCLAALRMWKRFMVGLRIKERVDGYEMEGEEATPQSKLSEEREDDSGMESEEYDDDGGGGFFPE